MLSEMIRTLSLFVLPHPKFDIPSSMDTPENDVPPELDPTNIFGTAFVAFGSPSIIAPRRRPRKRYNTPTADSKSRQMACPCCCYCTDSNLLPTLGEKQPNVAPLAAPDTPSTVLTRRNPDLDSPSPVRESQADTSPESPDSMHMYRQKLERKKNHYSALMSSNTHDRAANSPAQENFKTSSPMDEVQEAMASYAAAIESPPEVSSRITQSPPMAHRRPRIHSTQKLFGLGLSPAAEDAPASPNASGKDVLLLPETPLDSSDSSYGVLLDEQASEHFILPRHLRCGAFGWTPMGESVLFARPTASRGDCQPSDEVQRADGLRTSEDSMTLPELTATVPTPEDGSSQTHIGERSEVLPESGQVTGVLGLRSTRWAMRDRKAGGAQGVRRIWRKAVQTFHCFGLPSSTRGIDTVNEGQRDSASQAMDIIPCEASPRLGTVVNAPVSVGATVDGSATPPPRRHSLRIYMGNFKFTWSRRPRVSFGLGKATKGRSAAR